MGVETKPNIYTSSPETCLQHWLNSTLAMEKFVFSCLKRKTHNIQLDKYIISKMNSKIVVNFFMKVNTNFKLKINYTFFKKLYY